MNNRIGSSGGGVEDPLAPQPGPSQPTAGRHKIGPTSKRKAPDEDDNQPGTSKRTKSSQMNASANKSKTLKGEKKAGGLIINPILPTSNAASGPSSSSSLPSGPPPRPSSAQGSSQPKRKPPDKLNITKLDHSGINSSATLEKSKGKGKGKEREIVAPTRQDIEADEDVRRMDDERERLRVREAHAQSQSAEFKTPLLSKPSSVPRRRQTGFAFGGPSSTPGKGNSVDLTQPIPVRDTPTINRNRAMRGEPVKRRSSMSMRGKRVSGSFENTGVIPQPHPSVSTSNFHKHIDRELPEAHRARHLLVWCASRASAKSAPASRSNSSSPENDPPLPPLTAEGSNILQEVQKEVQKMLTEQRIDTSFGSRMDDDADKPKVKEHEQNVKNRKREDDFMRHIERCKQEDVAWSTAIQSYNARQASTVDAIARQRHQSGSSADWVPLDASDPLYERELRGAQLARKCKESAGRKRDRSPLALRMAEVESKVDRTHSTLHVSDQLTKRTTRHLNKRFELLSAALAARSQPPSQPSEMSTLANLVSSNPNPPSATGLGAPPDTLSILRALTRTDIERPKGEMGDAARRAAREVQRVNNANATPGRSSIGGAAASERRLTAVGAPTPRKAPGTPRRAGTPRQKSEGGEGSGG